MTLVKVEEIKNHQGPLVQKGYNEILGLKK
jgi:hypothetical protein